MAAVGDLADEGSVADEAYVDGAAGVADGVGCQFADYEFGGENQFFEVPLGEL
ncbi:hypothetical protein GCM10010510_19410 [Streptomyces anandii JCM 4720]|nr:hypothetical protein GCM10010510_19410 [Streptomyces anandii JCM 4720]